MKSEDDKKFLLSEYPYLVERISMKDIDYDVGNWIVEVSGDMIILGKTCLRRSGHSLSAPWLITYGFKHESDATAFKLRFG